MQKFLLPFIFSLNTSTIQTKNQVSANLQQLATTYVYSCRVLHILSQQFSNRMNTVAMYTVFSNLTRFLPQFFPQQTQSFPSLYQLVISTSVMATTCQLVSKSLFSGLIPKLSGQMAGDLPKIHQNVASMVSSVQQQNQTVSQSLFACVVQL